MCVCGYNIHVLVAVIHPVHKITYLESTENKFNNVHVFLDLQTLNCTSSTTRQLFSKLVLVLLTSLVFPMATMKSKNASNPAACPGELS